MHRTRALITSKENAKVILNNSLEHVKYSKISEILIYRGISLYYYFKLLILENRLLLAVTNENLWSPVLLSPSASALCTHSLIPSRVHSLSPFSFFISVLLLLYYLFSHTALYFDFFTSSGSICYSFLYSKKFNSSCNNCNNLQLFFSLQ